MKVLEDYEKLVGKTIAYVNMAQFADQITIATTDGEVLMAEMILQGEWGDEKEIVILSEDRVLNRLHTNPYIRKKLHELGIFDLEAYERQRQKELEEERRRLREQQEKREYEEYLRLKKKFEGE